MKEDVEEAPLDVSGAAALGLSVSGLELKQSVLHRWERRLARSGVKSARLKAFRASFSLE